MKSEENLEVKGEFDVTDFCETLARIFSERKENGYYPEVTVKVKKLPIRGSTSNVNPQVDKRAESKWTAESQEPA